MTDGNVKVWDICLRLFHWALAILFVLSSYSAFQDKFGIYADMHFLSGYTILILVVWRLIWGFVGSETARFAKFVGSPKAAVTHLLSMLRGEPYKTVGHSPLAGYSVLLMLILLLAQATMGLFASDGMIFSGPLTRAVDSSMRSDLTSWHRLLGVTLIWVVALHVLVVLCYAFLKRVNLVWPMISGNAQSQGLRAPTIKPMWQGLIAFVAAGGLVCTLVFLL